MAEVTLVKDWTFLNAQPGKEVVTVTPAASADVYTCKHVKPRVAFVSFADTSTAAADSVAATVSSQTIVLTIEGTARTVNLYIVGE